MLYLTFIISSPSLVALCSRKGYVEDEISDAQWLNDSGWSFLSQFSIASIPAYGNGNKTVFLAIADEETFFRVVSSYDCYHL